MLTYGKTLNIFLDFESPCMTQNAIIVESVLKCWSDLIWADFVLFQTFGERKMENPQVVEALVEVSGVLEYRFVFYMFVTL